MFNTGWSWERGRRHRLEIGSSGSGQRQPERRDPKKPEVGVASASTKTRQNQIQNQNQGGTDASVREGNNLPGPSGRGFHAMLTADCDSTQEGNGSTSRLKTRNEVKKEHCFENGEWDYRLLPKGKTHYISPRFMSLFESEQTVTTSGRDDCQHDFDLYTCSDHPVESDCYVCSKCSRLGCSTDCVKKQLKPQHQVPPAVEAPAPPSAGTSSSVNPSSQDMGTKEDVQKHNSQRNPKEKASTQTPRNRTGVFARPKHPSFQENLKEYELESLTLKNRTSANGSVTEEDSAVDRKVASVSSSTPGEASGRVERSVNRSSVKSRSDDFGAVNLTEDDNISKYLAIQMGSTGEQPINSPSRWPVGIPFKVKVLRIIPNSCVVIQSAAQRNKVEQMMKDLKRQCRTQAEAVKLDYCAVLHEENYYRAQIEEVCEMSAKCKVRLVDTNLIVVKTFREIYSLPAAFLRIPRQLGTMVLADVRPTQVEMWKTFLEDLINRTVTVTLTHKFESLNTLYYGSIANEDGKQVSDLLVEENLAEIHDYEAEYIIESIVKPKFEDYKKCRFKKNEVISAIITHIESPSEFFVTQARVNESEHLEDGLDKIKRLISTFVNAGHCSFSNNCHSGARMCLASHPVEVTQWCRAFCRMINFVVNPPEATVFLIDYGIVYTTGWLDLLDQISQINDFAPFSYQCRLAAKPIGTDWSNLVVTSLNSLMSKSKSEGVGVDVICIDPNYGKNAVTLRGSQASMHLLHRLEEAGHVIQDVHNLRHQRSLDVPSSWQPSLKHLDPPANLSFISNISSNSRFFYGRIPSAKPLLVLDKLKTRRLLRCHSYVVMSDRSYKLYVELKEHCRSVLKEKQSNTVSQEHSSFDIGDVVLAPWNPQTYQRACITEFETNCGVKFACCYFFDIVMSLKVAVKDLLPADNYCMKMEMLSHIIWLDGTTESTILHSKGYKSIMAPREDWTFVSNIRLIGGNNDKYLLRLSVEDPSGHLGLLTDDFKHLETWDWQKLYDLGFFTFDDIVKQMYPDTSFRFSPKDFLMNGKVHLSEMRPGSVTVMLRSVRFEENKLHLSVTPETVKMDFEVLIRQMIKFTRTVGYAPPSPTSTTYPHVVMLRKKGRNIGDDIEIKTATSRLRCFWHRCIYREPIKSFECVDCFATFKTEKNFDMEKLYREHDIDIREICPEMLKVAPLGKRLVVDLPPQLPSKSLVALVNSSKIVAGSSVDVVLKNSTWTWDEDQQVVAGIPVTIPKLADRIYQLVLQSQTKSPA